jgi:hypothetical protein
MTTSLTAGRRRRYEATASRSTERSSGDSSKSLSPSRICLT